MMGKHFKRLVIAAVLLLGGIGVMLELAPTHQALAANPTTINFQGKVVSNVSGSVGTNVPDNTYSIIFRIYNTASPTTTTSCTSTATCLWEETQASVTVTSGTFQVNLGSVCALTSASCNNTASGGIPANWSSSSLFLTMQFAGDAAGFMSPTIKLQSVPFAFNSDLLGGIGSSGFIQNNSGAAQSSSSFHIDGTGIADVKLQAPAFDTATSAGAFGIGATNAGAITFGNVTNSSVLFKTKYTAAALQVQNAGGNEIFTIDGSATEANNFVRLGKTSTINGRIVFDNATNANAITLVSGATAASGGSGYSLTLPTTGGAGTQCLQSTSGSTVAATVLTFAGCGGGGGTLASTYNSAATTGNTIALATAGGGIIVQDASSTVGSIFTLQNNGGTSNFFNVTSSAITIEDSGATHRTAVSIDITGHILKVFSPDGTTNFASISATNTDATFKSNTGNTIIGSGTGAVTINAGSGSAVNITGHANSTWQVDSGGTLTIQGGSTLSLLSTTTSAISLDSGSTGNVNIGTNANGKAIAIGNTQSGTTVTSTAGTVTNTLSSTGDIIKTGTNSTTAFVVQNTSNAAILTADTLNSRVIIGANGTATSQLFIGGNLPAAAAGTYAGGGNTDGGPAVVVGKYVYTYTRSSPVLEVIDVSKPASPALAGSISTGAVSPSDIAVQGHYVYIFGAGGQLLVYDITKPASPTLVGSGVDPIASPTIEAGAVQGRYAFMTDYGNGNLEIYDIANPLAPKFLSSTTAGSASVLADIKVQGNFVYMVDQANNTLVIMNATNPSAPTGPVTLSGVGTTPQHVFVSGQYAYVSSNDNVYTVNISNPASPAVVTAATVTVTPSFNANSGDILVAGHFMYITEHGANAIGVYDISTMSSPVLVGTFASGTGLNDITMSGRYLYQTAEFSGISSQGGYLNVFDMGGTYTQSLEAGSLEVFNTFQSDGFASFSSDASIQGGLTVGQTLNASGGIATSALSVTANSSTALQVQNSSSTPIVDVNTLTSGLNLIANPNLEVNINGWAPKTGSTVTYTDAAGTANFGTGAISLVTTATLNMGTAYNFPFSPSTQYSLSFYAKSSVTQNFTIGRQDVSGTDVDTGCTNGTNAISITTAYKQFTCTFTTGATITPQSSFYIKLAATLGAVTVNIDGITLVAGATALPFAQPATSIQVDANYNNVILNALDNANLQPWQEASSPITGPATTTLEPREDAATVNANGYMYVIGGYNGTNATNSVYYSKMNADGSIGSWKCQGTNVAASCGAGTTPTNALGVANSAGTAQPLRYPAATVANGYVYVVGGTSGAAAQSTIFYAKLNQDGSTGTWLTNAVSLPAVRYGASIISANGIIYIIGGCSDTGTTCGTPTNTIYYGKLTGDGSIIGITASNAFNINTNTLTAARGMGSAFAANGFLYYIGGHTTTPAGTNTVYYAPINYNPTTTDYSIGTFTDITSTRPLPANRQETTETVANGYAYIIGGNDGVAAPTRQATIYYTALQPDGTIGTWGTVANALPAVRSGATTTLVNGYIYEIGGCGNTAVAVCGANDTSTIFYSSVSRTQIAGALDLVGLSSQSLSDSGGAGALTAGNTRVVGTLTVDGYADFNNGLSVDSALNINAATAASGQTIFNINNLNSNSIFSIRHMSTNFGSLVTAGAFMQKDSYFGEEFNVGHNDTCSLSGTATNTVQGFARGDAGNTGSANNCNPAASTLVAAGELNFSSVLGTTGSLCSAATAGATVANGIERIIASTPTTASSTANCVENLANTALLSQKIYVNTNLPVIAMKLQPSTMQGTASDRVQVGLVSSDSANSLGTNSPTQSMYFTNCSTWNSAAVPTGCASTTWYGIASTATTATVLTCSTGSGSITAHPSYLRIEVRGTSEVHFYADYNTSDGINESECLNTATTPATAGTTTNISTSFMTPWLQVMRLVNGASTLNDTLDVDYFRGWQDDAADSLVDDSSTSTSTDPVAPDPQTVAPISPDSADPAIAGSFFNFNAATSEDTVFNNDVYVHGTLYADKIEANQIEGLSIYTNQISSLQQQIDAIQASSGSSGEDKEDTGSGNNNSSNSSSSSSINFGKVGTSLDLTVLGNLIANGSLSVGGDASFGGHLITSGTAPTIATEASAGITVAPADNTSGITPNLAAVTVDGNDISGQINLQLGDTASTGKQFTLTFNKAYSKAPHVVVTAANDQAAGLQYYVQATKTGFNIVVTSGTLTPGASLQFNYFTTQ